MPEVLAKALENLLDDIKSRAEWDNDCKVVCCGNGVFQDAEKALAAHKAKQLDIWTKGSPVWTYLELAKWCHDRAYLGDMPRKEVAERIVELILQIEESALSEAEAIEICESKCAPAVGHDSEGVPLCQNCLDMLRAEALCDAGEKEFTESNLNARLVGVECRRKFEERYVDYNLKCFDNGMYASEETRKMWNCWWVSWDLSILSNLKQSCPALSEEELVEIATAAMEETFRNDEYNFDEVPEKIIKALRDAGVMNVRESNTPLVVHDSISNGFCDNESGE